jgi:hypothetical protein
MAGLVESWVWSSSTYVGNAPPLLVREWPPDPPRILNCQRYYEIIKVPTEDGGEQQVRITRC